MVIVVKLEIAQDLITFSECVQWKALALWAYRHLTYECFEIVKQK